MVNVTRYRRVGNNEQLMLSISKCQVCQRNCSITGIHHDLKHSKHMKMLILVSEDSIKQGNVTNCKKH